MDCLKSIKLWQVSPHPIVKHILRALRDLPRLRKLYLCIPMRITIDLSRSYRLNLFWTPRDLLRHCRSLCNLRTLHLSDDVSSSNLRDIVKQMPHLKDLSFYIDRSNKWSLFLCHQDTRNHLTRIFDFLASKRRLEVLRIKGEINADNEAKSLANIKTLKSLDCSFANPNFVIYLTELTSLRSLRITSLHGMDISATYLQVIRSCKDLKFLRIFDYNISPNFVSLAGKVLEEIESENTLHLRVHGRHSSHSLKEFKSNALDHKNLLFRSITATELLTLI
ncbi:uncharacterized protein [Drosophila kikkawai]|nr:uncharacterized protein LOC108070399 isoform X2 [Drosophila kikkawai]